MSHEQDQVEELGIHYKYEEKEAKEIYDWLNGFPISKVNDIIEYFENYNPDSYIPMESYQKFLQIISDRFPRKDVVKMLPVLSSAKSYALKKYPEKPE